MSKDLYLEAIKWIKEYLPHRQETIKIVFDYVVSLEQQNTALQARIKELEEKDKLKNCEECYDKVSLVFKLRGIEK